MSWIFEVKAKTGRRIHLSAERWIHILKRPEMHNQLENIITILQRPVMLMDFLYDEQVKYYYGYFKNRNSKAKFLRVIVKYLNGNGFIITAYFVDRIK